MIKFIKYSKEESKIYYSNTTDEVLDVRIDFVEGYSNSLIQSHYVILHPGGEYWSIGHVIWENTRVNFYNQKTNELIAPFVVDGDKSVRELDTYGYIKEVQIINDIHQQCGVNDVIREHFFIRQYENFIDVEEGDVVVDVGFNFGVFSLGALYKGASKIYGFEPNKDIYEKLKKYPNQDKVQIFNYAVSNKYDTVQFNEGYNTLGSSITFTGGDTKKTYDVEVIDLYDFLIKNDITKIDFLKIDCEGEEYNIFQSIPDEFLGKINKIHVEFHNNLNNEVKQLIEKLEKNNFNWFFENNRNEDSECGLIFAKKKTKNIVLISTYCDTDEKINVLKENNQKIKENDMDVAFISAIPLPLEVSDLADFSFFTNENPVLDWPQHSMYDWSKHFINDKIIEIWNTYPDYGWAGLTHVKRLGEMFSQYDYDYYNYIIYDTIIDDEVLKILKVGHPKIVFPSKRNEYVWKVGLHLMSFNKENLKELISNINLSDYLSYVDFDAFAYLHNHLVKPLNIQIGSKEVEDSIFYYEEVDNKNHSHDKSIKYFISSPDEVVDTLKLYFYNIPIPFELKLTVNSIESIINVSNGTLIDLGITKYDLQEVLLEYNGMIQNITEKIKSIKNSHLTVTER